ncbi:lipoyltransferase 1, mitochondrial-like [Limulus polyphemus]|uniref:Lipoyltransferase 1, mitochondrial-like n=1 Tax=Limulus polyphemus TaxID=6850 RepID=A0ABM1S5S8_LIMPO|nr:lipoyltransferase 1, mitochondrial-like [Limulus polyphemus]XP_022238983.1 lipoyltransferase 1, mitochondrial-like [Limulus polyphemus]
MLRAGLHDKMYRAMRKMNTTTNNFRLKSSDDGLSQYQVIFSKSNNIFTNLALEDWFYQNVDFSAIGGVLLMWCNERAVVIGRHQNPWTECSISTCERNGVAVARRNSGGGTVYHDMGNLNCSFLSPRSKYNRKTNLGIICSALRKTWNLDVCISHREDILLNKDFKISGTASKLGRNNSYHHCTVLVNVDRTLLHSVLNKDTHGIESKATESVKANVINLTEICSEVSVEHLVEAIAREYQDFYHVPVSKMCFLSLHPSETGFPGLFDMVNHFSSWKWIFGWTPSFKIHKRYLLSMDISNVTLAEPSVYTCGAQCEISLTKKISLPELEVTLTVYKGLIQKILLNPQLISDKLFHQLNELLCGTQLIVTEVSSVLEEWKKCAGNCDDKQNMEFTVICIKNLVTSAYC